MALVLTLCKTPGCSNGATVGQTCQVCRDKPKFHRVQTKRKYEYNERVPVKEARRLRGTKAWKAASRAQRMVNPLCADPLRRHGNRPPPADDVHHVAALSNGGELTDGDNLQSLCRKCHAMVEAMGTGASARRYVVWGPPGAGKTTYVKAQRKQGDIIVDLDAIRDAISGEERGRAEGVLAFALGAMDAVIERLVADKRASCWVVTAKADKEWVELLSKRLAASVVKVAPPMAQCIAQIENDKARMMTRARDVELCREWYARVT